MKFYTLFASLAAVAEISYAAYCPKSGGQCNKNKKPDSVMTGKFIQQYKTSGYSCSGTIEIVNECEFNLSNFKFSTPTNSEVKWFGAANGSTNEGTILASYTNGATTVSAESADTFCWASLTDDIGVIRLVEDNSRVVCYAEIQKGGAAPATESKTSDSKSDSKSSSSKSDSKSSSKSDSKSDKKSDSKSSSSKTDDTKSDTASASDAVVPDAAASTTDAPAAAGTSSPIKQGNNTVSDNKTNPVNNNESNGAASNFIFSSGALYAVLLALSYYLYN